VSAAAGTRLGPYEIIAAIGAGGMGEVYRAHDPRLGRDVAIKVLPATLSADADRLRRFEKEARAAAALNHPNILNILDIGTHEGAPYVVSELLEGTTFREPLSGGALPVRKAVDLAIQIANGLASAHEKGIVHRDLKPENLFITADGRAKILDFGLAKLTEPVPGGAGATMAATHTAGTTPGIVLGTIGYMSPEQVRGQVVDHRCDIFSFGAILWEMVSGERAFKGDTPADTMSAILNNEPRELTALSGGVVSPALERIARHCLEKEPGRRFQSARDLAFDLEALSGMSGTIATDRHPTTITSGTARHKTRERVIWASAGFALAAVAAAVVFRVLEVFTPSPLPTPRAIKRMTINLSDIEPLALAKFGPLGIGRTSIALSPDGSLLAYAAELNGKPQLYLRALDQFDAKPIPGTEGAYNPFFSPDGRSLGFFSENKLKRVSLQGGEPVTLCEARIPHGASWGPDDTIVFADSEGYSLSQVPASGGKPQVFKLEGLRTAYPEFLPGGKAVLFSIWPSRHPDYYQIAVLSLATGERSVLLEGGTNPRYAASGHIVFARAGAILAAPLELSRLEVTGPAVTLIEGIRIEEWGAAQFALSPEGTLVYVSGAPAWIGKLTWVDHQGIGKPLAAPAQVYGPVRLSPDGQRLAVSVAGATNDVWIYELARETFTRLTTEGSNDQPLWTQDGKRIIYRSSAPNQSQLISKLADGSGAEQVLTRSKYRCAPDSWSPDGKLLAFYEFGPDSGFDLWMLPLEGDRKPYPWLKTKFNEWGARFSRDGKWIAYTSDESGEYEIYVRAYPGPGGKTKISTSGGEEVVWSPDGQKLFYREGRKWMSADVQTQPEFRVEATKVMFEGPYLNVPGVSYDVAPDGQRFIMIEENQKQAPTTQLNVVLNWSEELKQRVPPRPK
jgi:eukaryotic-like serine/threonine-protein kinase